MFVSFGIKCGVVLKGSSFNWYKICGETASKTVEQFQWCCQFINCAWKMFNRNEQTLLLFALRCILIIVLGFVKFQITFVVLLILVFTKLDISFGRKMQFYYYISSLNELSHKKFSNQPFNYVTNYMFSNLKSCK